MRIILFKRVNVWIAGLLLGANLLSWAGLLLAMVEPYVVEPIRDPEVVALLDYIHSGEHSGESWEVTLTELEAEQTITWYLQRYPQIPFEHPRVHITPDYVAGDTWEISPTWLPLVPIWGSGGVHSALVEVSLPVTVEARTWRDGVVSEVSEPVVYVPEPGGLVGLLAGIGVLAALRQ